MHRIFTTSVASVYPHYVAKVERKGRSKAELDEVYGARLILLDDINSYKNFETYQRLAADPAYRLREVNRAVRGGYAIFELVPACPPGAIDSITIVSSPSDAA